MHLYEIAASELRDGRGWRTNVTFFVITRSVERALALFAERHPGADVHAVQKRNRCDALNIDPDIVRSYAAEASAEP